MFTELFRFKASRDLESIKRGLMEQTGEDDFLGFEDEENQEKYLKKISVKGS